eukprot:TRINITY_DN22598_c0_g1_i3.p1 TRINITY_DN22598_c0_g1~~TRINITY_DN22598_c0_g1_i3.p1  ORF type:complete len:501 (+),score=81.56 TRINITY_DN22598_c0_g1_i3:127-1629(+)
MGAASSSLTLALVAACIVAAPSQAAAREATASRQPVRADRRRTKLRHAWRRQALELPDHTSELWCDKVVFLVNSSLQCVFVPRRRGEHIVVTASDEVAVRLPRAQGHILSPEHGKISGTRISRGISISLTGVQPRLEHPCGVLDFTVAIGRLAFQVQRPLAMMGLGIDRFENPYQTSPGQFTLAVSECFGRLSEKFEIRTSHLLQHGPLRPLLSTAPASDTFARKQPAKMNSAKQKRQQKAQKRKVSGAKAQAEADRPASLFTRGKVHVAEQFLSAEEVNQFSDWEARCSRSVERSDEKNEGERCLAQGCVAYCGLWQMVQVASQQDMQMFMNVTFRASAIVNNGTALPMDITAYDYNGKAWPHWATFQHYLPGGRHILHPDTDKGEHCISLAVSFSSTGSDFGGGEIQTFDCPATVPDCGNRGRSRTRVPTEGGPYSRRWPDGTVFPLTPGEWLWDGEPEAAFKVRQVLKPMRGKAVVWLSHANVNSSAVWLICLSVSV